jgi:hypothetical protein
LYALFRRPIWPLTGKRHLVGVGAWAIWWSYCRPNGAAILKKLMANGGAKLKKILVFLFAFVVGFSTVWVYSSSAAEVTTKLGWDADVQPSPEGHLSWDTVFIYQRQNDGAYDKTKPAATVPQTYVDGKSQPIIVTVKSTVPDQAQTTLYFIAVAGNGEKRSPDSEEVSRVADTTTLNPVTTFTAVHNRQTDMIDLAWSNDNPRVKEWAVYIKDTPDGQWVEFDRIKRTGDEGATVASSKSIVAPEGEETTKYFTVISFAEDVYSVDSMEARVVIDRRTPLPPMGFKIEYSIPVKN